MNLEALQREMAAAVMLPLTDDEQMRAQDRRWPLDGGDRRVVHRAQQPPHRL